MYDVTMHQSEVYRAVVQRNAVILFKPTPDSLNATAYYPTNAISSNNAIVFASAIPHPPSDGLPASRPWP